MSRVTSGGVTSNVNQVRQLVDLKARMKRKKRKKDLEQLRRNVLAAKQTQRREFIQEHDLNHNKATKSLLEKTLNNFAEIRQKNENVTQGLKDKRNKKPKGRTVCSRLLPEPALGLFENGAKGRELQRPTNLPLNSTNEARLRDDVYKLLNGGGTSSSSESPSLNNIGKKLNRSIVDEEKKDDCEFNSTSQSSQSITIKGNPLSDNVSHPQWKSNRKTMEKVIEKRREVRPDVSGNIVKDDRHNRRLFENRLDEDNCEIINFPQIDELRFSPRATNANDKVTQKKLQKIMFDNNVQSIKRWGHAPAFQYEELCAKIRVENFHSCYIQPNVSDPIAQVRSALTRLYGVAHGHHTMIESNDETPPSSKTRVSGAKRLSKNTATSYEVQACSTNAISTRSPASQSSPTTVQAKSAIVSNPRFSTQRWKLWNDQILPLKKNITNKVDSRVNFFHGKPINTGDRNISITLDTIHNRTDTIKAHHDSEGVVSGDQIKNQARDLPNYIFDEHSPPVGWSASVENQNNIGQRNVKHVPVILRKSSSRPDIAFNANWIECRVNENREKNENEQTHRSAFAKMNSEKSQHNQLLENSKYLLTPNIFTSTIENKTKKIHKSKIDYIRAKSKNCSRPQLASHNIINDNTKHPMKSIGIIKETKNEKDAQIYTISIPDHTVPKSRYSNYQEGVPKQNTKPHKPCRRITNAGERHYNNLKQLPLGTEWAFNHPLLETVDGGPVIEGGLEGLPRDNYDGPNIPHDHHIPGTNYPAYHHFNPQTMHHSDSLLTDINSEVLAHKYSIKEHDSRVPSMAGRWDSFPRNWQMSNMSHDLQKDISLMPEINRLTHDEYYDLPCANINDAVLQNFEVLSFEEDDFNESTTAFDNNNKRHWVENNLPSNFLHMPQPAKYLAVSKENDKAAIPRRIPVYSSTKNPSTLTESKSSHKMAFFEQQPPPPYPSNKKEKSAVIEKSMEEIKFKTTRDVFHNTGNIKNIRPIAINRGGDFPVNNYSSSSTIPAEPKPPGTSNYPINKPQSSIDSQACEIVLADGRIGLFVPKNCYHNNHMAYHQTSNNNNCPNQSTFSNNSMYHNNCQRHSSVLPNDMSESGPFF